MTNAALKPMFVRTIPDSLEEGVIYVSMDYRTAVHKCACGCGRNVITPLAPAQWRLIYDGKVSLHPSIGNWSFPCRSHYWIRGNEVVWAEQWSDTRVAAAKTHDRESLDQYYTPTPAATSAKDGRWSRLWRKFFG